jgi:membrane protease YdiL (CAAX protease family)
MLIAIGASFPLGRASIPPTLRWLWVPLTLLAEGWMLAYPLFVARRRVGLPPRPRIRAVFVEGSLALFAVPAVLMVLTGVSLTLVRVFGEAATPTGPLERIAGSPDRFNVLALVVLSVTVAPLGEEVFFRGMLYNALRSRLHPALAALLQAAAFGMLHPLGLADRAAVAVIGFCIAGFYEWRKTLLAPVLLHSLWNAASMAVMLWTIAAYANAPMLGVGVGPHEGGCLVTQVGPGSAAEESGLRAGDVVAEVGGEPVADAQDLLRVIRSKRVGEKVRVDYLRGGAAHRVVVTLRKRPD